MSVVTTTELRANARTLRGIGLLDSAMLMEEAANEIEKYQTKLVMIERIVDRQASDRNYCGGEATDEICEVIDGNHHVGAWYEKSEEVVK